jgi:N-acetylmuramoyl-L-alanine amidase
MSGADVTALQMMLVKRGYLRTPATGYYGPLTETAVSAYQKDHHIEQTGIFGHETINSF